MKLLKKAGLLLSHPTFAQNFSQDIVVDVNGTGDFTSLQAAFNAAPAGTPTLTYVKRDLYNQEKLIIPANKTNITLIWKVGKKPLFLTISLIVQMEAMVCALMPRWRFGPVIAI
tara:strand:+ start:23893 stop:24234 length:342 start_codon:yes stop_codon:yes gene_type:complete